MSSMELRLYYCACRIFCAQPVSTTDCRNDANKYNNNKGGNQMRRSIQKLQSEVRKEQLANPNMVKKSVVGNKIVQLVNSQKFRLIFCVSRANNNLQTVKHAMDRARIFSMATCPYRKLSSSNNAIIYLEFMLHCLKIKWMKRIQITKKKKKMRHAARQFKHSHQTYTNYILTCIFYTKSNT